MNKSRRNFLGLLGIAPIAVAAVTARASAPVSEPEPGPINPTEIIVRPCDAERALELLRDISPGSIKREPLRPVEFGDYRANGPIGLGDRVVLNTIDGVRRAEDDEHGFGVVHTLFVLEDETIDVKIRLWRLPR